MIENFRTEKCWDCVFVPTEKFSDIFLSEDLFDRNFSSLCPSMSLAVNLHIWLSLFGERQEYIPLPLPNAVFSITRYSGTSI